MIVRLTTDGKVYRDHMQTVGHDPIDAVQYVVSETRHQRLFRLGGATPRLLQGVFPFVGRGLFDLGPLNESLSYVVPPRTWAEVLYCRAGNHSDDLLYLALTADGLPIRYLPVGPKSDIHVTLAIVEAHPSGTRLEVALAAPRGVAGSVIIDFGLAEIAGGDPK